jgi:hypothetical protein
MEEEVGSIHGGSIGQRTVEQLSLTGPNLPKPGVPTRKLVPRSTMQPHALAGRWWSMMEGCRVVLEGNGGGVELEVWRRPLPMVEGGVGGGGVDRRWVVVW